MKRAFSLAFLLLSPALASAAPPSEPKPTPWMTPVFREKKDGYPRIRIPSLVVTKKGTLLAFAEGRQGGDHSQNDIILKRSTDGGRTWGPLQVVYQAGKKGLNNPCAVVLQKTGRVLLVFQMYPARFGERGVKPGLEGEDICRCLLTFSDDDGKTWSRPRDITRQVKRPKRVTSIASGPGIGIQLTRGKYKGRILIPFNQGPYGDWRVYAAWSDDGGKTWSYGKTAPEGSKGHANEVQFVELPGGSILLNARSAGGNRLRKRAVSRDGGRTWTPLEDDPGLPEPQCMASILRYSRPEDGKSRILYAGPGTKKGRKRGTLRVSYDEGKTWALSRVIYPGGYAYSCLAKLPGGDIGLLFEKDGYKSITFARVPLSWLETKPKTHVRPTRKTRPPYAVVASPQTLADPGWKKVVQSLVDRHGAKVFSWEWKKTKALKKALAAYSPRYVCFVAAPAELARTGKVEARTKSGRVLFLPLCGVYYHRAGRLMRSLDPDPYDDAIWAILTGRDARDALRISRLSARPFRVKREVSHVLGGWLEWLKEGVSFNEVEKERMRVKLPGKEPVWKKGPLDTTAAFVQEVDSGRADMIVTSGHATEHGWHMGYKYRSGVIIPAADIGRYPKKARDEVEALKKREPGRWKKDPPALLGVDSHNRVYPIFARNPKIYYSPGNCLIARVDGRKCLVLSWIHHGAVQFFGHVGLQTHSCNAWGIVDYFLRLQGRYTFAESVWLNQQVLWWKQARGVLGKDQYICCRNERIFQLGKKFVWEAVVLYGDPAMDARVEPVRDPLYEQSLVRKKLSGGKEEWTFTVTMKAPQKPSRPAAFLLPRAPRKVLKILRGPKDLLVADDFALLPFWGPKTPPPEKGRTYQATLIVGNTPR